MKIKNQTEIQLMKILFKTSGQNPTKNITSKRAYPRGIEQKYFRQLQSYFKPLTDYVKKYLSENLNQILRGDSCEIRLDAIPGNAFDKMLYNLENWLSVYMPDISELPEDSNNNVIFAGLGKTADETVDFSEKQFKKIIEKGIHVDLPTTAGWWNKMKTAWMGDNYTLITSNAKKYVSQINSIVEQGVVNGWSVERVTKELLKETDSLTKKHCKLLARDQIGKLSGQITQTQNEELGLELYVWDTSMDDRVRESHAVMQGLLCRWDDASVCSYDNGKTWVARPANAVDLHPGQDIQCRCSALTFYPELIAEVENVGLEDITEDLPPVQDVISISSEASEKYISTFAADEVIKNLSVSEKKAIGHYTEASYDMINNYLRGERINFGDKFQAKKLIDKMDKAFAKSKAYNFDLKLYRTEWANNDYSPSYKKGEKINLKSFISTSINKNNAKAGSIEYEIIVPKDKVAGIYIEKLSSHNEKEFLLNRNMWYEVLDVEEKDKLHKKFILKFLGDKE